ncbi:hypothetical protein [Arthrobacter sp.]|uniref:hypothetical protein n=1 Tax=Arthrobacter sp. TaxID=1667 RepID=UPI00366EC2D0
MTAATPHTRIQGRRLAPPEDGSQHVDALQDTDHPAQDCSSIAVGSTVDVIPPAGLPYKGRADAKTPDSGIAWVARLNGAGRQMHGNRDGVRLSPAAG